MSYASWVQGGVVIANRYHLEEKLGQGGQATVFRAWDAVDEQLVAVKMLGAGTTKDSNLLGRVAREQKAMVALAGTHAVQFIELCFGPSGALCLVMELLQGRDLEERLFELDKAKTLMPISEIVSIMTPLVETLDKAHSVGIVHRDLKPSNIFLLNERSGGGSRLLDFGMANLTSSDPLTAVGTVMGSPSYIAPEGWSGKLRAADGRADVYSLGVILFRMLGGRLPFQGKTLLEKMMNATTADRPSLKALRDSLPDQVDIWVERALAIDRNERFATAGACFGELMWALGLMPHPSEQRRVQLSAQQVVELREWLDQDDLEPVEDPTVVSLEPEALSEEEGGGLESLAPLALESLPASIAPEDEEKTHHRGSAALGPLPPIPRAPPLPAGFEKAITHNASVPAPERSTVRAMANQPMKLPQIPPLSSKVAGDLKEDATTFYERSDRFIAPRKR